ncbi:MAG: serine hydrolase [Dehalococcoidia bacterium]|nr:serine hydrolase [Dehalococcoidia bacterium]
MRTCLTMVIAALLLGTSSGCEATSAQEHSLPYVSPEEVGWSPGKLDEAAGYAEQIGSAAVMALYDGQVFFSYGDVSRKYLCHSIRKPFLGALYGIYTERGLLDLDATLEELGIDDIPPELTSEEKQASVRHLLQSRSGVYHEAAAEAESMIDARPERGSHAAGSFYYYNNWDFNALGTIFEQETGKHIFQTFKEDIADPIGMEDFSLSDCTYLYERDKSLHPAYCFLMSTRDMARFGLLYQDNGRSKDAQIVPPEWIEASTTSYSFEDPERDGYGYMWKVAAPGTAFDGGFYHTGLGVHLLGVMPDQKLVVVHRVDTFNDFDTTWEEIRTLLGMILAARNA